MPKSAKDKLSRLSSIIDRVGPNPKKNRLLLALLREQLRLEQLEDTKAYRKALKEYWKPHENNHQHHRHKP